MRALRESYRTRLPGLVAELAALVHEARRGPEARRAIHAARCLAHRLKGTAGSYGFEAASAEFAVIEAVLAPADAAAEAGGLGVPDWRVVEGALKRLGATG